MTTKPTVVVVPGSWQTPVVWDGFRALAEKEGGFPAVAHVALPTIGGTETPLAGLAEDVAAVRAILGPLVDEQEKDVVLLCHSSGGISGSNAVEGWDCATREKEGKKGGVVRIVFLAAFMLPKEQSLLGMLGGQPAPWMVVDVSLFLLSLFLPFLHP